MDEWDGSITLTCEDKYFAPFESARRGYLDILRKRGAPIEGCCVLKWQKGYEYLYTELSDGLTTEVKWRKIETR